MGDETKSLKGKLAKRARATQETPPKSNVETFLRDPNEPEESVPPHRTTLFIEWEIYKRLKQRSAETGQSLTRQVNSALRIYFQMVDEGKAV